MATVGGNPGPTWDQPALTVLVPEPGERTLAGLMGWAGGMVDGSVKALDVPPQFDRVARAVIVLVLDGLGWHQLVATDAGPWLSSLAQDQGNPIRAVLPSTTATNLTSLGTGRASGDHGILGYTMLLDGEVFNPLTWRLGLAGKGTDVRDRIVPESLVPELTMMERLHSAGLTTTTVVDPHFLDSGLTRAGLRGGQRVAASGLEETLARALSAVTVAGLAVAYAHHGHIDATGHEFGPHTPEWDQAVATTDVALASFVVGLPHDVALVITADHGMVAIDDRQVLPIHDGHPMLEGVTAVAGEPRFRTLELSDRDRASTVVERFAEVLDDRAVVITTDDAVAAGWFGDVVPDNHRRRLGDVIIASIHGSVPHATVDPLGGRLAGLHGSLTAAERDVPLLVATSQST